MLLATAGKLTTSIALLKKHLETHQQLGFNDMSSLLEGLAIKLFAASHGFNLRNVNQIKVNHPAIDLADDDRRVAVQVTSNANASKVRKTIEKFLENGLDQKYDTLFILGFLKHSEIKTYPHFCNVTGVEDLVKLVIDKHDEQLLQSVLDAFEQHADYSRLYPHRDLDCLAVVLEYVDRNAVKHRMEQEGSHEDMVRGLNEITEVVTRGTVGGQMKAKEYTRYEDPDIRRYLKAIRQKIGKILAVVNTHRCGDGEYVAIHAKGWKEINELKKDVVDLSNDIARRKGIEFEIEMIS